MRNLPPIAIIPDAAGYTPLTSTTVPETASTVAYNAGTTYAVNNIVSTGSVGGMRPQYQSLQSGNTGHTPASSPTWWRWLGDTYSTYDAGITYASGNTVIDTVTHKTYSSLTAGNIGNALTDVTKWSELGPTNRYAMFDLLRNTGTVAPSPLVVVFDAGRRINSCCGFGIVADTVTVSVTVAAVEVYSETRTLDQRETLGWYDYFYGDFSRQQVFSLWDLPPYMDATITVTFAATEGDIEVGGLALGNYVYVGQTEYGATVSGMNFSKIERDQWGNAVMTPSRNLPTNDYRVLIGRARVTRLTTLLQDEANGVPTIWSGLDDDGEQYFAALFILGYCQRYEFNLALPEHAYLTLRLEEI